MLSASFFSKLCLEICSNKLRICSNKLVICSNELLFVHKQTNNNLFEQINQFRTYSEKVLFGCPVLGSERKLEVENASQRVSSQLKSSRTEAKWVRTEVAMHRPNLARTEVGLIRTEVGA